MRRPFIRRPLRSWASRSMDDRPQGGERRIHEQSSPFYKPLWRRIAITAVVAVWLAFEIHGGSKRLTVSDEDRRVRDWFKAQCEALGCKVAVDTVGNMFALRPGRNNKLTPIAMGSHLDTQPTGGKFDGVLGVLGALEALRSMV